MKIFLLFSLFISISGGPWITPAEAKEQFVAVIITGDLPVKGGPRGLHQGPSHRRPD
jgi:hypothetical protein